MQYIEHKVMLYSMDTRHNQHVPVSAIDAPHYPEINEIKESVCFTVKPEVNLESEQLKFHLLHEV